VNREAVDDAPRVIAESGRFIKLAQLGSRSAVESQKAAAGGARFGGRQSGDHVERRKR
jgi:hypothetical protein